MNSRVSCFIEKIRPPGNNWTSHSYMHTCIHTLLREDVLCTIQSLAFKGTICNQIVPSTYMTARRWWRFCWGCLRFWWRSRCRCCGRGSTVSHWSWKILNIIIMLGLISRWVIEQPRSSFGSIFFLFPERSRGVMLIVARVNPYGPWLLMKALIIS